jgi:hypothetical protein
MRTIKLVLTALFTAFAVVAGLVVAMLAALASVVILTIKRWRHRNDPARPAPAAESGASRVEKPRDDEVIDVVATEVPADPSHR